MTAPNAAGGAEHTCHAKGCKTEVEPSKFMCLPHWRLCPAPMREAIKALYRPGQEIDKQPSSEYLAIAGAAINAVAHKESRQARPLDPASSTAPVPAAAPAAPAVRAPRAGRKKPPTAPKPIQLALF